ncbi:radical SAM protein [Thermodesulfobacteriota bacterium]
MAQYVWNSQLNLWLARFVKEMNPNCIVIAGGPNLGQSTSEKIEYLNKNRYVDVCVSYDGEIPFFRIIKQILENGYSSMEIRKAPVPGTYSLNPSTGSLIEPEEPPPRLDTLDIFETVHADGLFDEFYDDGFHPFVQTHRGCPFTCVFCHTSDSYYSRMLFQSPHLFKKDMEYLGKRFAGQHHVTLFIANTNMSLFEQDFEIARIIRDIQMKYDWPRLINVNSGKDPQKLLEMLSIFDFQPIISLQTLTSSVLKNIKRKNIPFDQFIDFQNKVMSKTGKVSGTELILTLPGETKETFLKSLSTVLNSNIQNIVIYTLMNLMGTPIATEESKNRYSHVIRHRIVPRQFSEINGERIIETEEVIVGSDTMPYNDYLELRGLSFIVKVFFSSAELVPLKRFLSEYGMDLSKWVFRIHQELIRSSEIYEVYQAYMKETQDELFPNRKALLSYFNQKEKWDALVLGQVGENLLRKYMRVVLYHNYPEYLEIATSEARKLIYENYPVDMHDCLENMLHDISLYLSTRGVKQILEEGRFFEIESYKMTYDIPSWIVQRDGKVLLEYYRRTNDYSVVLSRSSKKWIQNFAELNRDITLSLDNLFHEEGIENLWPTWVCISQVEDKR